MDDESNDVSIDDIGDSTTLVTSIVSNTFQLAPAVSTGELQPVARKVVSGRPFRPGQSGNPAGRRFGSRNKLSELFVAAMREDFAEHGQAAIAAMRERDPATYLAAIRSMIPSHVIATNAEALPAANPDSMSDAEWAEAMDANGNPREQSMRQALRNKAVEMVLSGDASSVHEAMRELGADV